MKHYRCHALVFIFLGPTLLGVVQTVRADLLVSSRGSNSILSYDETSAARLGVFASDPQLSRPGGLAVGPDHNLYVSVNGSPDRILRFSGATGAFLNVFASIGGLRDFAAIVFGPDGNLYASSNKTNSIVRFDGQTGAPLPGPGQSGANFVPPASGRLSAPSVGLAFGPDGNLYVNSHGNNAIMRYNGVTGVPLPAPGQSGAVFIPQGSGTAQLVQPAGLTFGPDGRLYVSTQGPNKFLRFEASGAFVDKFVPAGNALPDNPTALIFGPDDNLYVADSRVDSRVLRYDGRTGLQLPALGQTGATFIPPRSGGLDSPNALLFFTPGAVPEPGTLVLLSAGILSLVGYAWPRRRGAPFRARSKKWLKAQLRPQLMRARG
jgi:streptogramin lyase